MDPVQGRDSTPPRSRRSPRALAARLPLLGLVCCLSAPAVAQQPGAAPPDGRDALQHAVEAEIARASAALEDLRVVRQGLEQAREEAAAAARDALDRAAALRVTLDQAKPGSREVDRLFDEAVEQTVRARARLREAMTERSAPSAVRPMRSRLDPDAFRGSTVATELDRLEALLERVAREEEETWRLEADHRQALLQARWAAVLRLNDVRVRALNRMSEERRAAVLGLSRQGVAQLQREIEHVRLTTGVYLSTRRHQLLALRPRLTDLFSLGAAAWTALKTLAVVVLFVWIRRRGPALERWLRDAALKRSPSVARRRRLDALLAVARPAAPWALALLALQALRWALRRLAELPEARLAWGVALLYAAYRLAVELIAGRLSSPPGRAARGDDTRARIRRSVRAFLRVTLVAAVLLLVVSSSVGAGYLYHLTWRLAWIALALVLLQALFHWRREIVDTYLARGADGRLAGTVRRARDRWYGGFVAAAALGVLAGRAGAALAGRFVLGFDHTRRALAFLFRRRIEKEAERVGYARPDPDEPLAPQLEESLSEDPVSDERLLVDYFPGLDRLHEALGAWIENGAGGSFLLTGDYGIGRTSWLGRLSVDSLPLQRVTIEERIDSPAALARVLGTRLELGEVADEDGLRARLLELPRRVVVIDRGQNLFLGKVGGYAGFEAFMSLVDDTAAHVFWLVSFSKLAWEHISAVHPQLAGFRHRVALGPWPEEQIHRLIQRRIAAAGVEVIYDDLMLESLDRVARRVQAIETAEGYSRMLWDHCLGLPRVALHYWRRSLVPDGSSKVRVRLFVPPPVDEVEQLGDVAPFLLAAITVHESLTLDEMATVTRYTDRLCRIYAARLRDLGVIRRVGERHWVNTFWQPAVTRLLRRRNLLYD